MTRVPWIFCLLCFSVLCFALLTGDIGRSSQILTLTGDVTRVTSLYVSLSHMFNEMMDSEEYFQGIFGLAFTNLKNSLSGRNNVNPRNVPLHLHRMDLGCALTGELVHESSPSWCQASPLSCILYFDLWGTEIWPTHHWSPIRHLFPFSDEALSHTCF